MEEAPTIAIAIAIATETPKTQQVFGHKYCEIPGESDFCFLSEYGI